ncbi:MAG: DNA cytosine methyltransferase [Gammaproteobacteria bacterium]|nr:DNA cytosine methyltransferase [Gammaproteobacteria bacterium]
MNNAYYNEFDKKKCAMLSQLMKDGHITKGDIDDRSIRDVQPSDLKGYTRCHFFAGIGLWDHALNLAGWEEDRPVWTGSCPCQPFSAAGRQGGKEDDRHLWPEWDRLIDVNRPPEIFGEQVANAITKGWLDDVYQGLEAKGYAVGSIVLPASAVGAPHRRERLWFVANTESGRRGESGNRTQEEGYGCGDQSQSGLRCGSGGVANTPSEGLEVGTSEEVRQPEEKQRSERCGQGNVADSNSNGRKQARECNAETRSDGIERDNGPVGDTERKRSQRRSGAQCAEKRENGQAKSCCVYGEPLANTECERQQGSRQLRRSVHPEEDSQGQANRPDYDSSRHWEDAQWLDCPDGKQRLVEPSIPLLVNGDTERVGLIHAAGDAIVPQAAAEIIKAAMHVRNN